jgi:hypothetical protein
MAPPRLVAAGVAVFFALGFFSAGFALGAGFAAAAAPLARVGLRLVPVPVAA